MKMVERLSIWDFDGMSVAEIKENLDKYEDDDFFEVDIGVNWGNKEEYVIRVFSKEDNT